MDLFMCVTDGTKTDNGWNRFVTLLIYSTLKETRTSYKSIKIKYVDSRNVRMLHVKLTVYYTLALHVTYIS